MKTTSYLLIILFTLASCGHHHHGHHEHHKEHKEHHHQAKEEGGISLNNGKKWEADADLRKQMEKINAELKQVKKLEKAGKADSATYEKFHKALQANTDQIINTCKMPNGMHENFHVILEEIINTAEELKDPAKQKEVTGKLTATLKKYTEYFDHDLKVE